MHHTMLFLALLAFFASPVLAGSSATVIQGSGPGFSVGSGFVPNPGGSWHRPGLGWPHPGYGPSFCPPFWGGAEIIVGDGTFIRRARWDPRWHGPVYRDSITIIQGPFVPEMRDTRRFFTLRGVRHMLDGGVVFKETPRGWEVAENFHGPREEPSLTTGTRVSDEAAAVLEKMAESLGRPAASQFSIELSRSSGPTEDRTFVEATESVTVDRAGRVAVRTESESQWRGFWYDGKLATRYHSRDGSFEQMPAVLDADGALGEAALDSDLEVSVHDFLRADFVSQVLPRFRVASVVESGVRVGGEACTVVELTGSGVTARLYLAEAAGFAPRRIHLRHWGFDGEPEVLARIEEGPAPTDLAPSAFTFELPGDDGPRNERLAAE